jgi:hypothetical protein
MNKTLKEIHEIREKIYEEEKNLSFVQILEKRQKELEKFMKEGNMHLRIINKEIVNSR